MRDLAQDAPQVAVGLARPAAAPLARGLAVAGAHAGPARQPPSRSEALHVGSDLCQDGRRRERPAAGQRLQLPPGSPVVALGGLQHAHLLFQDLPLHMRPQLVLHVQQLPHLGVETVLQGVLEEVELGAGLALHPLQQLFHAVPAHQPFQHVPARRALHVGEAPADRSPPSSSRRRS